MSNSDSFYRDLDARLTEPKLVKSRARSKNGAANDDASHFDLNAEVDRELAAASREVSQTTGLVDRTENLAGALSPVQRAPEPKAPTVPERSNHLGRQLHDEQDRYVKVWEQPTREEIADGPVTVAREHQLRGTLLPQSPLAGDDVVQLGAVVGAIEERHGSDVARKFADAQPAALLNTEDRESFIAEAGPRLWSQAPVAWQFTGVAPIVRLLVRQYAADLARRIAAGEVELHTIEAAFELPESAAAREVRERLEAEARERAERQREAERLAFEARMAERARVEILAEAQREMERALADRIAARRRELVAAGPAEADDRYEEISS